jgi:hypothetical protein
MLTKLHASILHIHGLVGEKEATGWLKDGKPTVSATQQMKTPVKKPPPIKITLRKTTAAASAASTSAAATETIAVEGTDDEGTDRDAAKETFRLHYIHLREMDDLTREKLFILQVFFQKTSRKREI